MRISLLQLQGKDIDSYEEAYENIVGTVTDVCQTDTDLILLPECAFPGYFIGNASKEGWKKKIPELLDVLCKLAGSYGKYIGVGIALLEEGKLYNSLVLIDRKGKVLGKASKNNLWHFDGKWFVHGSIADVVETEFGKIGLMICADGRIPEVARSLSLQGAKLILDTVNLVAAAPEPGLLSNQQYSYILKTRARENGVYIAVCNKCGVEDDSVTMLGRSFVVSPDGEILVEASAETPEVVTCDINLEYERTLPQRNPRMFTKLAESVFPQIDTYLQTLENYVSISRFSYASQEEYVKKAEKYVRMGKLQNTEMSILPFLSDASAEIIEQMLPLSKGGHSVVLAFEAEMGYNFAVMRDGNVAEMSEGISRREKIKVLTLSDGLRIAVLFDEELLVPEIAHVCMLQEVDLIIWYDVKNMKNALPLVQTRAAENKVFVVRVVPFQYEENSYIVNPDGNMITSTFKKGNHMVAALVYTALSRSKTVVPGTNVMLTRHPEDYLKLVEES